MTAIDTVPFALRVAANELRNYAAAIVTCIQAGGDIDTTSAIVGGIVAPYTETLGGEVVGIPPSWLTAREQLPAWLPEQSQG